MINNDFFEYTNQPRGRCDGCRDCCIVYANGGWSFYCCYHNPYHGKWVAEIKNCPKENMERKEQYDKN